jgi:hypothetical protein
MVIGILGVTRSFVAELNPKQRNTAPEEGAASIRYSATGHPSIQELMAEQGTGRIMDVSVLHGDFWPHEESVQEILETLHEWRGRNRSGPAA